MSQQDQDGLVEHHFSMDGRLHGTDWGELEASASSMRMQKETSLRGSNGGSRWQRQRAPPVPEGWQVQSTWRQTLVRGSCVLFNVLCGFTNGYDICVISVILDALVEELHVCSSRGHAQQLPGDHISSCTEKGAIMTLEAAGTLFARMFLAWTADRYGRRFALLVIDVVIILAVVLQAMSTSSSMFLAGRFVLGVGIGLSFIVAPTYICEIAPADRRGQYVVMNELAVCIGCLAGLEVGKRMGSGAWRAVFWIGGVPSVIQLLLIPLMPESPRWLAVNGKSSELERVANRIGISRSEVECLQEIADKADAQDDESDGSLFKSLEAMWMAHRRAWSTSAPAFILALLFSCFVNGSGIYAMQAYSDDILKHCGIDKPMDVLPIVGWMKLVGAMGAVCLADAAWAGRKRLATFGASGCFACMMLLAVRNPLGWVTPEVAETAFFAWIFAWNIGYGSLQFVAVLELLPNEVRSCWAGLIGAVQSVLDMVIYQLFEPMLVADGMVTFLAFGAINLVAAVFAAMLMPDVAGHSLEESWSSPAFSEAPGSNGAEGGEEVRSKVVDSQGGDRKPGLSLARGGRRKYGKLDETGNPDEVSPCSTPVASSASSGPMPESLGKSLHGVDGI